MRDDRSVRGMMLIAAGLVAIAPGCSRAPKPTAVVPADTMMTVIIVPVPPDTTKAEAPRPDSVRTAVPAKPPKNGVSFPGTSAGSSTSAPAVVPQLTREEQDKLEKETLAAVEVAQKALDAVDSLKLDADRVRKYVIAKDFLTQATEARTRHEFERAQGLAVKAKLLAEELVR